MAKAVKMWRNHKGELVPEAYVSKYDKEKEKKLVKLLKDAKDVQKRMLAFSSEMFTTADILNEMFYKSNNIEVPKTSKGGLTLYSFDKNIKLIVSTSDLIDFDDKITIAQGLLNDYISEVVNGVNNDIRQLINNAFTTNKGRLDKARIFSLFQLQIEHPTWKQAMEMIKQSITSNSTKKYINIYERDEKDEYKQIVLNFSSL